MAKKQTENEISLRSAGEELGKLLIKLYNVRIFPRSGKVFADRLFETGIEAGSLVTGIHRLTEREEKIRTANRAVLALNEIIYICNLMESAGYYKHAEVKDIEEYAEKILLGLQDLLNSVPVQQRRIKISPSAAYGMAAAFPRQQVNVDAKRAIAERGVASTAETSPAPKSAVKSEPAPKENPEPETKAETKTETKTEPEAKPKRHAKPAGKTSVEAKPAPAEETPAPAAEEKKEEEIIPPVSAEDVFAPSENGKNGGGQKPAEVPEKDDDGFDDFA